MAQDLGKALAKKGGLTLAQLASYDDVLTDALVDRVYFWATIRKNRARFSPSRGILEEEIASVLRSVVIVERDAKEATDAILGLGGVKKYVDRLRSADEREHFQRHLRKYVNMYLPDCPFEVTTTNRYTIDTHEASVSARKEIRKGDIIKYLSGIQVAITEEEFKALSRDDVRLDFSIVHSSRKKTPSLFLGPARFANHDCNANARLSTTGSHGMQIIATRDIGVDEEITVTYGTDYFGEDNCECLCATCERLKRNGWALHTGDTEDEEEEEEAEGAKNEPIDVDMSTGYSLRRKRRSDASEEDESRSGTSTPRNPPKRQRLSTPETTEKRNSTPRGRRSVREVKVKTEHPLVHSLKDLPSISAEAQVDAHLTAQVSVQTALPPPPIGRTRARTLRASSGGSETSRASSASDSIWSRRSGISGNTTATSDGEVSDGLVGMTALADANNKSPKTKTKTIGLDIKTTLKITPTAHNPDDSDSELTTLSQFSVNTNDQSAIRMTPSQKRKRKLWSRELARLRAGSMERSLVSSLEDPSSATILTTETDITVYPEGARYPGDWTLTTKLLTGAYSRWVSCHTCDADFVQHDAYQTRKECPRCERHSKLYGYAWPKTDREGRWDTEERVLDHRTVHRFVEAGVERERKREMGTGGKVGGRRSRKVLIEMHRAVKERERARERESEERAASRSRGRGRSISAVGSGVEGSPRRGLRSRRSRLTM